MSVEIFGIVARDAPLALILRRGPREWTECLLWNFDSDEVTAGQWLRATIHIDGTDLSPDGRYLLLSATDYRATRKNWSNRKTIHPWHSNEWAAVSRPPYFTALHVWFGDHKCRGGVWTASDELVIGESDPYRTDVSFRVAASISEPRDRSNDIPLRVRPFNKVFSPGPNSRLRESLKQRGWSEKVNANVARSQLDSIANSPHALAAYPDIAREFRNHCLEQRDDPVRVTVMAKEIPGGELVLGMFGVWKLKLFGLALDADGNVRLTLPTSLNGWRWLDVDDNGRIIYDHEGCLWAWADFPYGEAKLVADLNDHAFRPVAPPEWALRW